MFPPIKQMLSQNTVAEICMRAQNQTHHKWETPSPYLNKRYRYLDAAPIKPSQGIDEEGEVSEKYTRGFVEVCCCVPLPEDQCRREGVTRQE